MSTKPTIYETMAVAISHELNDSEVWFTGLSTGSKTMLFLSLVPLVGMWLAQHTHTPNSHIRVSGWVINPVIGGIPEAAMHSEHASTLRYWRCESIGYPFNPDNGSVDVGFGSAAQVDKYGNCNIVCIGDYYKPKVRLIGPINQPAHFSIFGKEYIIMDHEKRNFVDRVDFISGVGYLDGPGSREKAGLTRGGPYMILTDKAIFDFHPQTKLARLKSVHPGITLDEVIENTGYTHDYVPENIVETTTPTDEELRIIREVIDPRGMLLPR